MKKWIVGVLCLIGVSAFAEQIKIGYVNSPPFAYLDERNDFVVGTDVDIIRSVHRSDTFDFIRYDSFSKLVDSFEKDGLSYGIGGASITPERNKSVIFSIPTEKNEITYAYDSGKKDPNAIMSKMLEVIWKAFVLLFIALTVIAHTIWLVERFNGDEHNFSKNYFKGIAQAYYWAVVVCSTVGFGDIVAKTPFGRFLTCIIIFGGIIWFGTFITFLNTETERLNAYNEFTLEYDFTAIGVLEGSTSEEVLERDGIIHIKFNKLEKAIDALKDGKIECMVYDKKPLEFFTEDDSRLTVATEVLEVEYLGIICATEEMKDDVDSHIIKTLN